jgi:excisionase family DNA binding protein
MMSQYQQDEGGELAPVLTVQDVQRHLRISRAKAYELTHTENFPVVRIGRAIRIPRDPFLVWLRAHGSQEKNNMT